MSSTPLSERITKARTDNWTWEIATPEPVASYVSSVDPYTSANGLPVSGSSSTIVGGVLTINAGTGAGTWTTPSWGPLISGAGGAFESWKTNLEMVQKAVKEGDPESRMDLLNVFVPFLKMLGINITEDGDIEIGVSEANKILFRQDGTIVFRGVELEQPERVATAIRFCFEDMVEKISERLDTPIAPTSIPSALPLGGPLTGSTTVTTTTSLTSLAVDPKTGQVLSYEEWADMQKKAAEERAAAKTAKVAKYENVDHNLKAIEKKRSFYDKKAFGSIKVKNKQLFRRKV